MKRLVVYLISIDSAYTRMLNLAAHISINRIEIVLPCNSALFNASSATAFFSRVQSRAALLGKQIDLASAAGHTISYISILDSLGLKTFLDVLILCEAAYRYKLLSRAPSSAKLLSFVPSLVYTRDVKASRIARALVSIGTIRMSPEHRDTPAALS